MAATRWILVAGACSAMLVPAFDAGTAYWLKASGESVPGRLPSGSDPSRELLPVRSDLLDSLRGRGWIVRTTLRWANLVSATAPESASLPSGFDSAGPVAIAWRDPEPTGPVAARGLSVDPAPVTLRRMHGVLGVSAMQDSLRSQLLAEPGQGMRVAVIDDGFVLQHETLKGALVGDAWDFVSDDSIPWDEGPAPWAWNHGTGTAALIASRWSAVLPGIAPSAELLLYRAEDDDRETPVEEDYLAAAIERAVLHGASVVSISLGYRYAFDAGIPDHPFATMDGRTLVASRTASWAASRDVLVVVAMGNEGDYGSRSLGSPADADSILSVGAVAENGLLCGFSSTGPTADGRVKPELVAFGCSVPVVSGEAADAYYDGGAGTSYAAPLVAGMALLLRQYRPTWTAMQVRDSLMASGSRAATPDTLMGWGLPDLAKLLPARGAVRRSPRPRLPGVWKSSRSALRFQAGTEPAAPFEFTVRELGGRVVHRTRVLSGTDALWTGSPSPGVYTATWVPEVGDGASATLVVTDR